MRNTFLICSAFLLVHLLPAQTTIVTKEKMKVVVQLMTNDTLAQKSLLKQVGHLLEAAPNTKVEVVCHNNGITLLQSSVTKQSAKIKELHDKGVDFVACQNTMRDRKLTREDLVADCRMVPSGVVEIVMKESHGWAYLKAGF